MNMNFENKYINHLTNFRRKIRIGGIDAGNFDSYNCIKHRVEEVDMNFVARHRRAIKGCIIASGGYAFFAINQLYLNQSNAELFDNATLVQAENDNTASNIMLKSVATGFIQDTVVYEETKEKAAPVALALNSAQDKHVIQEEYASTAQTEIANTNVPEFIKTDICGGNVCYIEGKIGSNFYTSAQLAHVPAPVIKAFINVLKPKINFRSNLQSGDCFAVAYNKDNGKIVYAHIKSRRHTVTAYKGVDDDKYYLKNGVPLCGASGLIEYRKPVNYSRISSPYGYRFHPISGVMKKHTGIDYAAPLGTPVYAAYNGQVKTKGVDRYLGKYVIVKHDNGYETLYAHLSAFNNNLEKGQFILCGTQVGRVGSTGRSTGPHLHFGLKKNGTYINPAIRATASKAKLCGNTLNKFQTYTNKLDAEIRNARS